MAFLALPHRQPVFGIPQRKPIGGRHRYELNPAGILSRGLQMALLLDGPLGLGGLYDYAKPNRTFSMAQGAATFSVGAFGNQVNCGFDTPTSIGFTPTIPATPSAFSCSFLVLLDGSAHSTAGFILISDGASGGEYVSTQTGIDDLLAGGGAGTAEGNLHLGSLTGWHRIGVTAVGTNPVARFFVDGKFDNTATAPSPFTGGAVSQLFGDVGETNFSWGWNVADLFFWNRALTDTEMAAHFADPYGSVIRPRYSERWRGQMTPLPGVHEVRRRPRNEMVPI